MNSSLLELPASLWGDLIADLRIRGGGVREAGAFLLGTTTATVRTAHTWIPYDELDATALSKGYVRLDTEAFSLLWSKCAEKKLTVVADIHTHPWGPRQSFSDRTNPMISQAGHIALIAPRYAQGVISPEDVSCNIYLGEKRWESYFGSQAQQRIRLT